MFLFLFVIPVDLFRASNSILIDTVLINILLISEMKITISNVLPLGMIFDL